jgi:hypothetical protein
MVYASKTRLVTLRSTSGLGEVTDATATEPEPEPEPQPEPEPDPSENFTEGMSLERRVDVPGSTIERPSWEQRLKTLTRSGPFIAAGLAIVGVLSFGWWTRFLRNK